ncbi:MAG: hypothetical protein AB1330_01440 [Bacillota bacterium]
MDEKELGLLLVIEYVADRREEDELELREMLERRPECQEEPGAFLSLRGSRI